MKVSVCIKAPRVVVVWGKRGVSWLYKRLAALCSVIQWLLVVLQGLASSRMPYPAYPLLAVFCYASCAITVATCPASWVQYQLQNSTSNSNPRRFSACYSPHFPTVVTLADTSLTRTSTSALSTVWPWHRHTHEPLFTGWALKYVFILLPHCIFVYLTIFTFIQLRLAVDIFISH